MMGYLWIISVIILLERGELGKKMKTLEKASDALLDKDWGAKIPDYLTKGTFSIAVFFMSLTMRGETLQLWSKCQDNIDSRRLVDVSRPLLEVSGAAAQLLHVVRSDQWRQPDRDGASNVVQWKVGTWHKVIGWALSTTCIPVLLDSGQCISRSLLLSLIFSSLALVAICMWVPRVKYLFLNTEIFCSSPTMSVSGTAPRSGSVNPTSGFPPGKYWPLIGQYWSRDLNTGLWLADISFAPGRRFTRSWWAGSPSPWARPSPPPSPPGSSTGARPPSTTTSVRFKGCQRIAFLIIDRRARTALDCAAGSPSVQCHRLHHLLASPGVPHAISV